MLEAEMLSCRECGKEFGDWHALGGQMRMHRPRKGDWSERVVERGEANVRVARALGRLSELSPQEAWQVVVNWIIDVYREARGRDEAIQAYRLRQEDSEARIEGIQSELKKLQQMVSGGGRRSPGAPSAAQMRWAAIDEEAEH
jgi:hypothetical protein